MQRACTCTLLAAIALLSVGPVWAAGMTAFVNVGGGPQGHSNQSHRSAGLDLHFYQEPRGPNKLFSIGVGYTYINSNSGGNDVLHAVSLYPQLRVAPANGFNLRRFLPDGAEPYFLIRFVGPTYISENSLGDREQDNHFSLQTTFGFGFKLQGRGGRDTHVSLSWKHFSNANLFSDNDGIDVPLVLSFGKAL